MYVQDVDELAVREHDFRSHTPIVFVLEPFSPVELAGSSPALFESCQPPCLSLACAAVFLQYTRPTTFRVQPGITVVSALLRPAARLAVSRPRDAWLTVGNRRGSARC